jgi:hypothetical protein
MARVGVRPRFLVACPTPYNAGCRSDSGGVRQSLLSHALAERSSATGRPRWIKHAIDPKVGHTPYLLASPALGLRGPLLGHLGLCACPLVVGSAASRAAANFPLDSHGGPRSDGPEQSPVHGILSGRLERQISLARSYPSGYRQSLYLGQQVLHLLSVERVLD